MSDEINDVEVEPIDLDVDDPAGDDVDDGVDLDVDVDVDVDLDLEFDGEAVVGAGVIEGELAADELTADEITADDISGEIDQLAVERDQYKDIAQRLQADFENYRKRVAAQQTAEIDRATGALAEALLPVLDAAEAAYVGHPDEVGPLLNLLLAELKKRGLETIDLLEQPFDPNLADAVAHEPGDGGEPVVTEVLRSGYTWNGRTLRPAMVRTRD